MLQLVIVLCFWTFYSFEIFINGAEANVSRLTIQQIQIWNQAVFQLNNQSQEAHIEIIHWDYEIEIPLYNDRNLRNRHLFKQNINKQVDLYVYENQPNSSIMTNIYDVCHEGLFTKHARARLAGIYVYTVNQTSKALGIIIVENIKSFQWFNGTEFYSLEQQTNIANGTELTLGFETSIYYNSNSDLILINKKINDIIQQANMSIINTNSNLELFFSMQNLSCQRHQQIVYDDLRSLTFACTVQVTFKCPLQKGSACWLENKQISNIVFNINSLTFKNNKTITVRIDV